MTKNIEWQTIKPQNVRMFANEDILLVQSGWAWEEGDNLIVDDIEVSILSVSHPKLGDYPDRFGWSLLITGDGVPELRERLIVISNISDNGISKVWREDDWIYKRQMKFLTDNEIWCLKVLHRTGYVPYAEQIEIDTIRLQYIENQPVIHPDLLWYHFGRVLKVLDDCGIRHGDLTKKNIIINKDKPYLVDFAESRLSCDIRPDKRPDGDAFWFRKTIEELCNEPASD